METVIDTAEVKSKLQTVRLGEYYLDEFCRVLAVRLPEKVTPLGFLMAIELLKMDAKNGDGLFIKGIGEPIRSRLSSVDVGLFISLKLQQIAEHSFPKEFAEQIISEYKSVLADAGGGF